MSDEMEEETTTHPCWFSFSINTYRCDFGPDDEFQSKGSIFDDATAVFVTADPAFANTKPITLDEVHLVKALRTKTKSLCNYIH